MIVDTEEKAVLNRFCWYTVDAESSTSSRI